MDKQDVWIFIRDVLVLLIVGFLLIQFLPLFLWRFL